MSNKLTSNIFFDLPSGKEGVVVHVPKSGGFAVRSRLFKQNPTYWHPTWSQIVNIEKSRAMNAIKVAIIRHPIKRTISLINNYWEGMEKDHNIELSFELFQQLKSRVTINGCVNRFSLSTKEYLAGCVPDFIIRQESLQEDVDYLCQMLNLKQVYIPHENVTRHKLCEWETIPKYFQNDILNFVEEDMKYYVDLVDNFDKKKLKMI